MSWRSKWTNGEREKKGETEMERDMGSVERDIGGSGEEDDKGRELGERGSEKRFNLL